MIGATGRWLLGLACGLPARSHRRIAVERGVPVPMPDGVTLIADIYAPDASTPYPVVLIRSPYGRGSMFGMMAALLAERGYRVVLQSARGTAGSGGTFDPMRQERADGAATLDWVRAQPWFGDKLYTLGGSYLGNAQWAMASANPGAIDGAAMSVCLSNFRNELRGGDGYTLEGTMAWTLSMQGHTGADKNPQSMRKGMQRLKSAHSFLPVGEADQPAFGRTVSWWRDWTGHDDPQDPWWQGHDFTDGVTALDAPITAVAGWQDIFLPFQLKDFAARQAAGKPGWLTVGPWGHVSPGGTIAGIRTAIELFDALGRGDPANGGRANVRLYLQKAKEWREYPSWPPPGSTELVMPLTADKRLLPAGEAPQEGNAAFTYDPADPTPSLHGPQIMGGSRKPDMTAVEQRADTISFDAAPCDRDTDLIGPVTVDLTVQADSEQCDFYVCLCDVGKDGKPMHISDGYLRLRPVAAPDSLANPRQISIECWPTAYRLKRGHRLRLLIAGGAFPRFARNLGTGEPLATGGAMRKTQQSILTGSDRDSKLRITVQPGH